MHKCISCVCVYSINSYEDTWSSIEYSLFCGLWDSSVEKQNEEESEWREQGWRKMRRLWGEKMTGVPMRHVECYHWMTPGLFFPGQHIPFGCHVSLCVTHTHPTAHPKSYNLAESPLHSLSLFLYLFRLSASILSLSSLSYTLIPLWPCSTALLIYRFMCVEN